MSWPKNIKHFFKRHWLVIALAVVVGALCVAPHFLAVESIGSQYKGIPFMYLDDEDIYLARMQEVLDGHWLVGSPFFHEYKATIPMEPPLGEYVYAIPSMVTRIPLTWILIASKFLFPAVLFILVYLLVYVLTKKDEVGDKMTSAAAGLLVTLAYSILGPSAFLNLLRGQDIGIHLQLWTRPVNPILGALCLFGFLILLWKMWRRQSRCAFIPAGILLAISVFYFFSWGAGISVAFILFLIACAKKDWKIVKQLALTVAVSFIVSSPYWYSVFRGLGTGGKELAEKNGMFYTHAPLMNKTLLATMVIFLALTFIAGYAKKEWKKIAAENWWQFCLALLIGGLWALNQQMITGRTIWPYHFVQYTNPFCVVVLMVAGFKLIASRFPKLWRGILVIAAFLALANGVAFATTYRSKVQDFAQQQSYAQVYEWFNKNTAKDCVVLVKEKGEWLTRQIPAFTHCDVYVSSWIFNGVPAERVQHNFFVQLHMNDVTADNVKGYLTQNPSEVREYFFDDWHQLFATGTDLWLAGKIDWLSAAYADFQKTDFGTELKKYKLDFILTTAPLSTTEKSSLGIKSDPIVSGPALIYRFGN